MPNIFATIGALLLILVFFTLIGRFPLGLVVVTLACLWLGRRPIRAIIKEYL